MLAARLVRLETIAIMSKCSGHRHHMSDHQRRICQLRSNTGNPFCYLKPISCENSEKWPGCLVAKGNSQDEPGWVEIN